MLGHGSFSWKPTVVSRDSRARSEENGGLGWGGAARRRWETVDWVYMRFCTRLVVVLFGLGCAAAAYGQAGVYLGYQATQLRGITCFEPAPIQCSSTGGKVNPAGYQVGGYYDFRNVGPMRLGVDVRGGVMHSNKSATSSAGGSDTTVLDNVLVGARGSFHTPISWLSPYAQISVGYARSNATLPFGTSQTTPAAAAGRRQLHHV